PPRLPQLRLRLLGPGSSRPDARPPRPPRAPSMIDPEQIRRRLTEVWTSLGDEVMRACALTLITVVDSENSPSTITQTLAELMPEHPSRSIVVRLESEDCLEADVEAQCWMPFGQRRQICSEQIVIRCSVNTLDQVPGVVLPLIVPDLPLVVW